MAVFTVTTPSPPAPGARRFRHDYLWRFLFTGLDSSTITMPTDLITQRRIAFVLNQASAIEFAVRPDDFRVNGIWTDGYPRLAQSNRLVYCFRREGGAPVWTCRAAGILMSPQDQGDADVSTSHFAAYDPWKLLEGRPCTNSSGVLPGPNGLSYFATAGNTIAVELLKNTIVNEGGVFIDAGVTNGGTIYYGGTIETTNQISFNVQQGQMVADAWNQLCEAGNMDIVLTPIYDPTRRPGYTHELNIYKLAGTTRHNALFSWNQAVRNLTGIDRVHAGTPGDFINKVQYFAGQGGAPLPALGPLTNLASIADFGPYWSQQFFPNLPFVDPTGAAALALAHQVLDLSKQGRRSLTITPIANRAPIPFVDYDLGDLIPVYASPNLRVLASGNQRVQAIPVEISDDGVEHIGGILCTPDVRVVST